MDNEAIIGNGIRDEVQNLKDDLNAKAPKPGVASGVQSGSSPTPARPGRSDASSPVRDLRQDQYGDRETPGRSSNAGDDTGEREMPPPNSPSKTDH